MTRQTDLNKSTAKHRTIGSGAWTPCDMPQLERVATSTAGQLCQGGDMTKPLYEQICADCGGAVAHFTHWSVETGETISRRDYCVDCGGERLVFAMEVKQQRRTAMEVLHGLPPEFVAQLEGESDADQERS